MTQVQPPEFDFVGVRMKLLLSGADTGNQFALLENTSAGVSQTPVHIHADDDETVYMIEGEMEAVIGGQRHVIRAGETVFLPRGVPHQADECQRPTDPVSSPVHAGRLRELRGRSGPGECGGQPTWTTQPRGYRPLAARRSTLRHYAPGRLGWHEPSCRGAWP